MATYSSIPAWALPWTEEPGGLWSMGSQESNRTKPPPPHHWNISYAFVFFFFLKKGFICLFIVCTVQQVESTTLTRDGTCVPRSARQSLNHWTTGKVSRHLLCLLPSFASFTPLQQSSLQFWNLVSNCTYLSPAVFDCGPIQWKKDGIVNLGTCLLKCWIFSTKHRGWSWHASGELDS